MFCCAEDEEKRNHFQIILQRTTNRFFFFIVTQLILNACVRGRAFFGRRTNNIQPSTINHQSAFFYKNKQQPYNYAQHYHCRLQHHYLSTASSWSLWMKDVAVNTFSTSDGNHHVLMYFSPNIKDTLFLSYIKLHQQISYIIFTSLFISVCLCLFFY